MKKSKIAFFGMTSCKGCFFEFLLIEKKLLEILKAVDIIHFKLIKEYNEGGPFDITFMDGAVSTKRELKLLKKVRENTKYLIALGSCACWGGINSIKNLIKNPEKYVYDKPIKQKSLKVTPIDQHVKVDYYLRGCPFNENELIDVVKNLLAGKVPKEKDVAVCIECRERGNKCLFEEGIPCMGPVTYGGCDAPCPTKRAPCDGCRGPLPESNWSQEVKLLKKHGITKDQIKKMFNKYAVGSKKFGEVK